MGGCFSIEKGFFFFGLGLGFHWKSACMLQKDFLHWETLAWETDANGDGEKRWRIRELRLGSYAL